MNTHPGTRPDTQPDTRPDSPAYWWRQLCTVRGTRLVLSGDLSTDHHEARRQLDEWRAAGVTHVIDVRHEHSDEAFVAEHAPEITYVHLGVDDGGQPMEDGWFDQGVGAALRAFDDPDSVVLVHCHMGVNRGPSMGFAILLALGFAPKWALQAIAAARPIAAVLYARDALGWWHRRADVDSPLAYLHACDVEQWETVDRPDVRWVISRVRRAERGEW